MKGKPPLFQKLRVLLIVSESPPVRSGIARTTGNLADELRSRGHDVDVASASEGQRFIKGEFRLSDFVAHLPRIGRTLSSYDVINLHGPLPAMSDLFLLAFKWVSPSRRPALVYTHHFQIDVHRFGWLCKAYNDLHKRLANRADHVIVSTASYHHLLTRRGDVPITVIPWGIEPRFHRNGNAQQRPPLAGRPLRILFVGQMRAYKGVEQLIEAVRSQYNLSLTIAGEGPLFTRYRDSGEMPANVRMLGSVHDVELEDLYATHDVIALPSLRTTEAYGLVLLEGMALGCVPVASDLPGVRDVAGQTGILTKPGNVSDLRRAFRDLSLRSGRLADRSKASIEFAQRFSHHSTVDRYEEIFLLEARRRRLVPPVEREPARTIYDDLRPGATAEVARQIAAADRRVDGT